MAVLRIGDKEYPVVHDTDMPDGKRAVRREHRPTNQNDAARLKRVQWDISGPIGNSRESIAGTLATDYTQNLETRFRQRLFSLGKRTAVDIDGSGTNPPVLSATTPSVFGTAYFGTSYFGGTQVTSGSGSSSSSGGFSGDVVRHFAEQQGYLLVFHGALVTQVGPLSTNTWSIVETELLPAQVISVAHWQSWVWVAHEPVQRMTLITESSAAGMNVNVNFGAFDFNVTALAEGSDRLWFALQRTTDDSSPQQPLAIPTNKVSYTLTQFATYANPFPVGDTFLRVNGIGSFGPYTHIGKLNGPFSFTDQGKPAPLSRSLYKHNSVHNGSRWADPGWGWHYYISDTGLRAINQSGIDNPVAIGERMPAFTGHGGRPTAVHAERGEMWVAYLLDSGVSYMYRCTFGAETAGTGQPEMYPSRYMAATEFGAITSTNTTTNTSIVWGENGDIAYETIDRFGRDDQFTARRYSDSGGIWYGTTLDRDPHLLKTIRLARIRVLNVEDCSDWQLAVTFDLDPWDTDPEYMDWGPLMFVPGQYTLRPTAGVGGQPIPKISGRNFKIRLTQRAEGPNAETLPPEVNGPVEVEYDERPAMIEEVTLMLEGGPSINTRIAELVQFASESSNGPELVQLPGDLPRDRKWAMVAGEPQRKDLKGDGVEVIEIVLQVWESA